MQNQQPVDHANDVIEISLSDIFAFIKRHYRALFLVTVIAGILGLSISFLMSKEYSARTLLLPEAGAGSKMGKLGSLAGLAGINLGGVEGGDAVRPDLYPDVLKSAPFALFLLNQPVVDENNRKYKTLKLFLEPDTSTGFLGNFLPSKTASPKFKPQLPGEVVSISLEDDAMIKKIQERLSASIDMKTGIISIQSEMPDPVVAALTVQKASDYLTNYVIDYRTQKSRQQAEFLAEQAATAKQRQQRAEYALQSYRDQNRNAYLNVARIEEQRLQSEYTFSQSLYSDLVRQWEQAKIKVKEEQPVFKVLEPSRIPLRKSTPNRLLFGISFALLSMFGYLLYVLFYKEMLHKKLT
ncbi:Wzz/FepE/Etk N-terminal domain-containing protein [Telluribacter sp.]|jgi:uncharacterized protein involved in exopolysaccharide biosynthesis|uniref:Wzz/FepE/Etk N-terminal domain-containing protein n=1 Tax=Telluribacter sp. TaxID=1978767 RepID=UPI002E1576FC|nr:Wzz/FepE/Etk N-terminal domain-containing protein [Telluribacter sp.]